jgi:hypothetical protein
MRISIDPNVRVENNWTYSGFEDVFGDVHLLNPGDWVTAMWAETDQIFDAKVVCLEFERRIITLAVDWKSVRVDQRPIIVGTVTISSGGRTRRLPLGEAISVPIVGLNG